MIALGDFSVLRWTARTVGVAGCRASAVAGRRALGVASALALLAAVASACHGPLLPTELANCYEGLPLAETALNAPKANYVFHGVKMVTPQEMERLVRSRFPRNPGARPPQPTKLSPGTKVCAFAFTGDFAPGQVAGAPANASGKAAVVLITTKRELLFSFVLSKLPEAFNRPFTGA